MLKPKANTVTERDHIHIAKLVDYSQLEITNNNQITRGKNIEFVWII